MWVCAHLLYMLCCARRWAWSCTACSLYLNRAQLVGAATNSFSSFSISLAVRGAVFDSKLLCSTIAIMAFFYSLLIQKATTNCNRSYYSKKCSNPSTNWISQIESNDFLATIPPASIKWLRLQLHNMHNICIGCVLLLLLDFCFIVYLGRLMKHELKPHTYRLFVVFSSCSNGERMPTNIYAAAKCVTEKRFWMNVKANENNKNEFIGHTHIPSVFVSVPCSLKI